MANNVQILKRAQEALEEKLPEKVGLASIQDFSDILIFQGLKRLQDIINYRDDEALVDYQTMPSNDEIIKAISATVNIGKYIDKRIQDQQDAIDDLEIDDAEYEIGDVNA